jgi:hypothetical protein
VLRTVGEVHIKELVQEGYIDESGKPLKCHKDDCPDLIEVNKFYGETGLEEYSLKCKFCGDIVGTWSFGNWDI